MSETDIVLQSRSILARFMNYCDAYLFSTVASSAHLIPVAIAQELWPPRSLDDLEVRHWIAHSPYSTRVDNMEKCCLYLDSSVSPLLEGDAAFTIFYEPQVPPRKANDVLASFLPGHLQWLGNILVVKHLSRNIPMHSEPIDRLTVIGIIFHAVTHGLLDQTTRSTGAQNKLIKYRYEIDMAHIATEFNCTDDNIEMLNWTLRSQASDYQTMVKGFLFHPGTPNVHIVDIPSYKDVTIWLSIDDLDTRTWCDSRDMFEHVWNIDATRHQITECPKGGGQLLNGFTIYTMDQRVHGPLNGAINSLVNGAPGVWTGNVLVVKNGSSLDQVTDILLEDFPIVSLIIKRSIENKTLDKMSMEIQEL